MMKLPFRISADNLKDTYNQVRNIMNGNEHIIFEAMNALALERNSPFIVPSDRYEYEQKHREIEEILAYPYAGRGIETAMRLMEEILRRVSPLGGVPGYSTHDLLEKMQFRTTTPRTTLTLTEDLDWAAKWDIYTHPATTQEPDKVFLDVYSTNKGEIVPAYLAKYVDYAILAYQDNINIVALALLSIAIEVTLRDVLACRNYSFDRSSPPVNIYGYARADVGVSGNAYTLTFKDPMPLSPTDFLTTYGGQKVEIEIRRNINTNKGRVDLLVKDPHDLIEYWSANKIVHEATKRVNGLGEALNIARNVEKFINPSILLPDFDEVIKVIRNNLVHLSGAALTTHLPTFDHRSPQNRFTLQDFLNDDELVYDFVRNVPRFISGQYNELRKAGS